MRAEWGWQYYEVCSISLRAVFPVKSSLFRLVVKLHCCIEMEGEGREGRKKKKKERERENVKASLEQQGSTGWLCAALFSLGVDGQGGLPCCSSWGCKESDTIE